MYVLTIYNKNKDLYITYMKLTLDELKYVINESYKLLLSEINTKEAYERFYQNIPMNVYKSIVDGLQPNINVLLPETKWYLELYKKGDEMERSWLNRMVISLHTDENEGYLDIYKRLKVLRLLNPDERDLNKFPNLSSFLNFMENKLSTVMVNDIMGNNRERKKKFLDDRFIEAKNDIHKWYEDEKWLVISPFSYEASVYWGHGTNWCTAYKHDKSHWDDYYGDGCLFINVNKETGDKYQFHFGAEQYMDKFDKPIECPALKTMGATKGLIDFYLDMRKDNGFEPDDDPKVFGDNLEWLKYM